MEPLLVAMGKESSRVPRRQRAKKVVNKMRQGWALTIAHQFSSCSMASVWDGMSKTGSKLSKRANIAVFATVEDDRVRRVERTPRKARTIRHQERTAARWYRSSE